MSQRAKKLYHWLRWFPKIVLTDRNAPTYLSHITKGMDEYDMVTAPSEDYYKSRYIKLLKTLIQERFNRKTLRIFDAGCGQGRISIELAKMGHTVDAIDYVKSALIKGREYAKQSGVEKHITWKEGQFPDVLSSFDANSYDLVLCLEVLYMMAFEKSKQTLEGLAKLTRKGGHLVVSVRSRFFYLAYSLLNRDLLKLEWCAKHPDFADLGDWSSWLDPDDLVDLFERNGFKNIKRTGLGILSGIEGDPTSHFCMPHLLAEKERELLGEIEDRYGKIYPDTGRYVICWGEKY